jgi:hypothetical protein
MSELRSHGLLAEFKTADGLLEAVKRVRAAGYRFIEAYAPFPVKGLAEAVGMRGTCVPLVTFLGGLIGGAGTYFMLWYSAVIDYAIDSGSRPLHSWPAFIPPTFELTVLGAAFAAFFSFLFASGLPRLHHPIFNAPDFDLASRNRFFLCIECRDPRFDEARTRELLQSLEPVRIASVPT